MFITFLDKIFDCPCNTENQTIQDQNLQTRFNVRERCKKKNLNKKLTSVSFMYVCVAENGEMLVFFSFLPPTRV